MKLQTADRMKGFEEGKFQLLLIPWAQERDIIIVHDNACSDIIFDGRMGKSILQFPGAKENCVEFYSLSKSCDYTGARVGFLVGNEAVVQSFKKLRSLSGEKGRPLRGLSGNRLGDSRQ